eukprot:3121026-Alexandrium_andersonii.AAC.1
MQLLWSCVFLRQSEQPSFHVLRMVKGAVEVSSTASFRARHITMATFRALWAKATEHAKNVMDADHAKGLVEEYVREAKALEDMVQGAD